MIPDRQADGDRSYKRTPQLSPLIVGELTPSSLSYKHQSSSIFSQITDDLLFSPNSASRQPI